MIYVLSKNKKNVTFFYLKITIFIAVKYYSVLYGRVIIMELYIMLLFQVVSMIFALWEPIPPSVVNLAQVDFGN